MLAPSEQTTDIDKPDAQGRDPRHHDPESESYSPPKTPEPDTDELVGVAPNPQCAGMSSTNASELRASASSNDIAAAHQIQEAAGAEPIDTIADTPTPLDKQQEAESEGISTDGQDEPESGLACPGSERSRQRVHGNNPVLPPIIDSQESSTRPDSLLLEQAVAHAETNGAASEMPQSSTVSEARENTDCEPILSERIQDDPVWESIAEGDYSVAYWLARSATSNGLTPQVSPMLLACLQGSFWISPGSSRFSEDIRRMLSDLDTEPSLSHRLLVAATILRIALVSPAPCQHGMIFLVMAWKQ